MDIELSKELYYRELDRRDQLDSSITLRVAVVTLLAGLFSYYASAYDAAGLGAPWLFIACASGAAVTAGAAVVVIISALTGYTWAYIALPTDLLEYYDALVRYEQVHGLESKTASEQFEHSLRTRLVAAATHNVLNNNSRSEKLYLASRLISIAVVLGLVAGLPLAVDFVARTVSS